MKYSGQEFHAVLFNSTSAGPVSLNMYDINGRSINLLPHSRVVICEIAIVVGTAMRVDVIDNFDNNATATEANVVLGGQFADNGGIAHRFHEGRALSIGQPPVVIQGGSGVLDVMITGVIVRG